MSDKKNIGANTFISPMLQTILGTVYNGKPNFMALGWAMRVNHKPCLVGACVHQSHASHSAIRETGQFSIGVPDALMVAATDYIGLVSGEKVDKSELFDVFYGDLKAAPMITDCPLSFECELHTTVDLPTNTFYIGEVKAVWTEERFLTDGKPDAVKMNPFFLSMPDNRFYSLGDVIGSAWHDGKSYRKT